ncbi:hypothetical protein BC834DRAFT_845537 [Gloeopeniophorella convolvens]|nr:hypothetical protein BC834DRAFT_845537 [Gloeopeniophorella convolvens]
MYDYCLLRGREVTWMCHLSFDKWRRGLFRLDEDYCRAVLRTQITRWIFQVFNMTFIAAIEKALLLLIALPALRATAHPTPSNRSMSKDLISTAVHSKIERAGEDPYRGIS